MSTDVTSAIPAELRERPQWMTWTLTDDGTKIPNGKSNDPSTWHEFTEIGIFDNIAFVIAPDDPYTGIDLDGCIVDGEWTEWAKPILERFLGIAYAEVSPSGTGVKLTTKAKKPAGSRCTHKIAEGKQQIECYDNRRFWTVTANVVEGFEVIGDGQSAVDWLCGTFLSGQERQTGPKREHSYNGSSSLSLLQRAQAYADKMAPAGKGDLRNAAFRNAGHLHAIVGGNGERLTDSDVYHLLRGWNARNAEQLRDDELLEAAANGRKNGTPPADKPPAEIPSNVDLSKVTGVGEQQATAAKPPPIDSAADLFRGLLDRLRNREGDTLIRTSDCLAGFEIGPGLITVMGAPPGAGKSALASQAVFDALAMDEHLTVLVANAEMSWQVLARRELARRTGLGDRELRFGDISDDQLENIEEVARVDLLPLMERIKVMQAPYTIDGLEAAADAMQPGLMVVDYLQKFAAGGDAREAVNAVMTKLRWMTMDGWAVLALSATSRTKSAGGSSHDSKGLSLASFKESGEIEFNADSAYLLRDLGEIEGQTWKRRVMLDCVKNRHGERARRELVFDMPRMLFTFPPADFLMKGMAKKKSSSFDDDGEGF